MSPRSPFCPFSPGAASLPSLPSLPGWPGLPWAPGEPGIPGWPVHRLGGILLSSNWLERWTWRTRRECSRGNSRGEVIAVLQAEGETRSRKTKSLVSMCGSQRFVLDSMQRDSSHQIKQKFTTKVTINITSKQTSSDCRGWGQPIQTHWNECYTTYTFNHSLARVEKVSECGQFKSEFNCFGLKQPSLMTGRWWESWVRYCHWFIENQLHIFFICPSVSFNLITHFVCI